MTTSHATKNSVFQAADALYAAEQNPTIKAVREWLGCGSNTTIHKYLTQWKEVKALELEEVEKDNTTDKLKDVTQQLKHQQRNNQQLAKELLNLEHKLVATEQELKTLTTALNNQIICLNETTIRRDAAEQLVQTMQAERDSNLNQVLQVQQQLIQQFQDDLKQINQDSLHKVSEISVKNQDAWMAEKVKNKTLEMTIAELKTKITTLEGALQQEKNSNQPLRKKIAEQETLIAKHVNWEALVTSEQG